jgi:two-component system sensor histidine kinase KdpD
MVHAGRKTPEELLREAESHDAAIKKGYLKIFLGYASGVGKSFRMLDEARRRRERGQDVVVGAVQPHAPPEVDRLLTKLEVIPLKPIGGGTAVDLEALLARHPDVCFIDGLAYDNPLGSGNATRWEDAKELVQAGIKVIASINIQYVSELRERIEAITGKQVTQTVPISFIKSADEIEIVDAPALESLAHSSPDHAAGDRRQQQIPKLREMALVLTADVVDHQLSKYLESHGIKQQFGAQERILVCITPSSNIQEMLETAQIITQRFHGELYAVHVNRPKMSAADRAALEDRLTIARATGAQVEILEGPDPVNRILEFARARHVTQLFIGHSGHSRFWSRIQGSPADKLIRHSRGMDVRIFPNKQ